jgi:hypothetical protein
MPSLAGVPTLLRLVYGFFLIGQEKPDSSLAPGSFQVVSEMEVANQPRTFFTSSATRLPWTRQMARSSEVGASSPFGPEIVLAP